MNLVYELAENYAAAHTTNDDDLLKQIHHTTSTNHSHAHMLSSHVQGMLLTFISSIIKTKIYIRNRDFYRLQCIVFSKRLNYRQVSYILLN
jgi:caffeoyl-CoA O-methyltransferase